jgi:hypothetical protein
MSVQDSLTMQAIGAEEEKYFICPACRYTGRPVYLPKRDPHPNPKAKDYSDVPMCPYCLNQGMWRNGTVMVEK